MSPPKAKGTVVVTGFGPFGSHGINASWVAVQELEKIGLNLEGVDLVIYEIAVVYEHVKKVLRELWERHKPLLMVHVGVSGVAEELTLEQQAHNDGYDRDDVDGLTPPTKMCVDESCDKVICSGINMSLVSEHINSSGLEVKAVVSFDAGRYLCDFSYFTSLHISRNNTAFIHVPPLNKPYTSSQLAQGLQAAIYSMLKQVV